MAEGGDISSFLSSSPLHVDCSSTFTRFLSLKLAKRRFIWSGSVEELSRFIEVKFAMVNDCNGGGFVKLSTNLLLGPHAFVLNLKFTNPTTQATQ